MFYSDLIYFFFIRTWQVDAMTLTQFKVNPNFTFNIKFDVSVHIDNQGYTEAELKSGVMSLYYKGSLFGYAGLVDSVIEARGSEDILVHVSLPDLDVETGLKLLEGIIAGDGIIEVVAIGTAKAIALGMRLQIHVVCDQVVNAIDIPSRILQSSCTYHYNM